jgi:hypothetical protein
VRPERGNKWPNSITDKMIMITPVLCYGSITWTLLIDCTWVRYLTSTMHLGHNRRPFVPHVKLWEPCNFTEAPDGPLAYAFNILRLQEKEAQIRMSEWGQNLTFTKKTWTFTQMTEQMLCTFIRRTYSPIQDKGLWRRIWNSEICNLYKELNIVDDIKIRRLGWAGHIIWVEYERIPHKGP